MLDLDGGEQSSSFATQIETTEGLTLGKGTDNEVSLTAAELKEVKSGTDNRHFVVVQFIEDVGAILMNEEEVVDWLTEGVEEFYLKYDPTGAFIYRIEGPFIYTHDDETTYGLSLNYIDNIQPPLCHFGYLSIIYDNNGLTVTHHIYTATVE